MSDDGVRLDLHPNKWNKDQGDITCRSGSYESNEYVSYKYTNQSNEGSFKLSGFKYNEKNLSNAVISPEIFATKVMTYFDKGETKLLVIEVETTGKQYYYTNADDKKKTSDSTTFDRFITKDSAGFRDKEMRMILSSITNNNKLDYDGLDVMLGGILWRTDAIEFNLSKTPVNHTYHSDITDVEINVQRGQGMGENFLEVKHIPKKLSESFYIKGLCDANGKDVSLDGGFPNDTLKQFLVFYKGDDKKYEDPLLVILIPKENSGDPKYISSTYFISKNATNTWNVRRIAGTDVSDRDYIQKILENIHKNKRLKVELLEQDLQKKLTDITIDLLIDINQKFDQNEGKYTSEKKTIPYKKTKHSDYIIVSHAYTFSSFTLQGIKVGTNSIEAKLLPNNDTRIYGLTSFYKGNSTTDPLLICMIESTLGNSRWIYRSSGDKNWTTTGDGETLEDDKNVELLLDKLNIPNVYIDVSQAGGDEYFPKDNTLSFKVTRSNVNLPECTGFIHSRPGNADFSIQQVTYQDSPLNGIASNDKLDSITAYYYGNGNALGHLLMIRLEQVGGGSICYKRKNKDVSSWMQYNQDKNLDNNSLKTELEKLMKEYGLESFPKNPRPSKSETKDAYKNSAGAGTLKNQESSPTSTSKSSDSSSGAIVGGILGGIACLCLLGVAMWKVGPSVRTYLASRKRIL